MACVHGETNSTRIQKVFVNLVKGKPTRWHVFMVKKTLPGFRKFLGLSLARPAGTKTLMSKSTIALCLVLAAVGGCVEREMTITSEPEGALVFVSDVEIGRTPVTIPFMWYGDYDVLLRYQGYQTLKTHAQIIPPIYEIPPFDLLSHLAPWTYHDRRYLHFKLEELQLPSDKELTDRAEQLRLQNLSESR